jgi:hypothetical protein
LEDGVNGRAARLLFLVVCAILAILLMRKAITPLTSGLIFAAALVTFGVLSRGFRK